MTISFSTYSTPLLFPGYKYFVAGLHIIYQCWSLEPLSWAGSHHPPWQPLLCMSPPRPLLLESVLPSGPQPLEWRPASWQVLLRLVGGVGSRGPAPTVPRCPHCCASLPAKCLAAGACGPVPSVAVPRICFIIKSSSWQTEPLSWHGHHIISAVI